VNYKTVDKIKFRDAFNEDGACIQLENAVVNFNVLRKFALNALGLLREKSPWCRCLGIAHYQPTPLIF
jgi:hypothetical protein